MGKTQKTQLNPREHALKTIDGFAKKQDADIRRDEQEGRHGGPEIRHALITPLGGLSCKAQVMALLKQAGILAKCQQIYDGSKEKVNTKWRDHKGQYEAEVTVSSSQDPLIAAAMLLLKNGERFPLHATINAAKTISNTL